MYFFRRPAITSPIPFKDAFTKRWPLTAVIVLYWTVIAVLILLTTSANDSHLIYPLDDTYIHMSMAKNLVNHGVWGVTRFEFSSSTTSPAWVALLASGYFLFGVNETAPLILNILFGTLALVTAYRWIALHVTGRFIQFAILSAALFAAPLPTLTITGMEHVLHALLTIFFIIRAVQYLSEGPSLGKHALMVLLLTAALLPMVRLEGAFTVFMASLLLLRQQNYKAAVLLSAAGAIPVIVYGVWSIGHGWFFFPNSILLKAHIPAAETGSLLHLFGLSVLGTLKDHTQLLFITLALLTLLLVHYGRKEHSHRSQANAVIILAGNILLHLQFASTGWFFRYEAYLIFSGIIVVCLEVHRLLSGRFSLSFRMQSIPAAFTAALLLLITMNIFSTRIFGSMKLTVRAATNIYEQQYQMGSFLRSYCGNETVVLNDIGAAAFLSDVRIIDLWGLGTKETAELKMKKKLTSGEIERIAKDHDASIALVYEPWFTLPGGWKETGLWRISNNVVAGNEAVNIYSVDTVKRTAVIERLRQFSPSMPNGVEQLGVYME